MPSFSLGHRNINFLCNEIYNTCQSYCMTMSKNNMWAFHGLDRLSLGNGRVSRVECRGSRVIGRGSRVIGRGS